MFGNSKNNLNYTIYAPASSPQKSGIIVIRVSGKQVLEVITNFKCTNITPRYATLAKIYHPITGTLIDQAILVYYKAPNSFTGEDVLEINIHGSRAVLKITLDALSKMNNLRMAEPGEFSMRSFINGKMDLTQIEGLADLIDAETKAQHSQALKQMSGSLRNLYYEWKQQLVKILSLVEAVIDFPDEDIPDNVINQANNSIADLANKITTHLKEQKKGQKIREGLYIAIIGPTNAGKSSIINRIAKKEVAIVSQIEGTTRDVIEVNLDINGYPVIIADTAGLRESNDILEKEGIKRSISRAQEADLKIIVSDATNEIKNNQNEYTKYINTITDNKTIKVVNKIDLIHENDSKNSKNRNILDKNSIAISAKENIGIDKLLDEIIKYTNKYFENINHYPLITRQRYIENLSKCRNILTSFSLNKNSDIVLIAEDLRVAASYIARITGEIEVETILGEIFSSFCIGK